MSDTLQVEDGRVDVDDLFHWISKQRQYVPIPDSDDEEMRIRSAGIEEECRGARKILQELEDELREKVGNGEHVEDAENGDM